MGAIGHYSVARGRTRIVIGLGLSGLYLRLQSPSTSLEPV
jgi:hypothetical protein